MTQRSSDKARKYHSGEHAGVPALASSTIYEGSAVGDSSGYGRQLVAGDTFRGFALEQCDNSDGSSGDKDIIVQREGCVEIPVTGSTIATHGSDIYASDGDTFTTTESTNSLIGKQVGYNSATSKAIVKLTEA